MSWSSDPKLQQMFVDEVAERSARLVEGAQALRTGTFDPQEAGNLVREGHTIKGTGRVMGYDDVGSAGLMLEMLWRWIQHSDLTPTPIFGRILEALSASVPRAIDHPAELAEAMFAVHEFFEGQTLPEELPPVPVVESTVPVTMSPIEPETAVRVEETSVPLTVDRPVEAIEDAPAAAEHVEAEPEPDAETAAEVVPETEAPMSAQEAFAALRRSMQTIEAEVTTPSLDDQDETDQPAADRTGIASELEDVEIAHFDETLAVGAADAVEDSVGDVQLAEEGIPTGPSDDADMHAVDESIGHLIEFPRGQTAVDDPAETPVVSHEPAKSVQDESRPDVVVLPSGTKRSAAASLEPADLGGLVGAIQTWAAEETISVNAGRLYGLVDHIVSLRMDIESVKESLVELSQIAAADPFFSERLSEISDGLEPIVQASDGVEGRALGLAAAPLRDITNTLPQLGRYLSRKTGKEIRIELIGDDVLVDRQVLDRLGDAIRQLVVNAAVHGIEDVDARLGANKSGTGVIRIEADTTDVNLEVSVIDDGRGIDWRAVTDQGQSTGLLEAAAERSPDALRSLLYQSGFSTRDEIDELAGDGEGLAIVQEAMAAMNGSLTVESMPGEQTAISMTVPIHQAMQKALLVTAGGITWGIPETGIQDVILMVDATIAVTDRATVLEQSGDDIPFASFADLMGLPADGVPTSIVVATSAVGPVALGVEEVVGLRRIAARELGAVLADADAVTGAALVGGEEVVLLVDTTRLAERQHEAASDAPGFPAARVLIVDDSRGVQQVVSSALATSGFNTSVAGSVADALGALHSRSFDAIVVDFSMPRADGVALVHMVRQRHGDVPIVMLSGVAEGEDIERAREAGVDAFFGKDDFREGGLADTLRKLIANHRAKEHTA